ncbi:cadherin EGF LAG seven-pass G-type receptor 2-like [Patiria miniata]|uniref:Uncharacterized protein n=1 Tax=Patiria miniata TaxID=46514 RepID=A0A913ZSF7_PATMI|nr:cadherin EGF LAG seven-pass G-type receptor 2-like [Patiria miniata]
MKTCKSRSRCLILLVASLHFAHAHYVPCTIGPPHQTISNTTAVPSGTDFDIEKPQSTNVGATAHSTLPTTVVLDTTSNIESTDGIDTKTVENVVSGNYNTVDTMDIDTSTSIDTGTEVDVASPTETTSNSQRTTGIDTPTTAASVDSGTDVDVTLEIDIEDLQRPVIDDTSIKPYVVPTKTGSTSKQPTDIPFTTSIDTTPKIDIDNPRLKTTASIETTTVKLNVITTTTVGTSRPTTDFPSKFESTTGIDTAASTDIENLNDIEITFGIGTTTRPKKPGRMMSKPTTASTPLELENTFSIDTAPTTEIVLPTDRLETTAGIDATITTTPGIDSDLVSTSHTDTINPTEFESTLRPFTSTAPKETSIPPLTSPTIPPNLYSPVFYEDVYYSEVYEYGPLGTILRTVQALDWDQGGAGNITYSISSGADDEDGWEDFAVHPVTGVVFVVGELDRETKGAYMIELTATDQGMPPRSAVAQLQVTVLDVNDNRPLFEKPGYEAVIDEDAHPMSRVLHVTATDKDSGTNGAVMYMLSGHHSNTFSIDHRSGLIRTRRSLDRERIAQYTVKVIATDHLFVTVVEVLVRVGDVNDNAPKFPSPIIHLNVTENNLPFGPIGKVTATDADEGPNAQVSYAFVQQRASQTRQRFQIERGTGIVHTLYRFDREQRSEYEAIVRASSGRLFTDASLVIHILDLNDNPPTVPSTQELFYNFHAGFRGCHIIGKVGALDKDIGDSLKFRLLEENNNFAGGEGRRKASSSSSDRSTVVLGMSFALDENTGIIRACHRRSSTYSSPSAKQLAIEVSDGLHNVTCSYTMYLLPVDDQSLNHGMSLRLRIRSDVETFLSRYRDFVSALTGVFKTTENFVTLMVRGGLARSPIGVSESPLVLRAFLAVRRRDGTVLAPDEVRSLLYLESEQLRRFADIIPDPVRPQCRLVPTLVAGEASVVTEVALGLSYTAFNVSFRMSCGTPLCGASVCSEFEECVRQVVDEYQEEQFSCRCLFPGNTNCQPPFPAGNCSEAVCNHHGSCAVDNSGWVDCLCRDQGRYDGPRCQMTTRSFTDGSFLAFMPLGRLSREFHISLRFKTLKSNGLLLYNGQLGGMRGESVALQIVGGRLHFSRSGRLDAHASAAGSSASIARNVSDGVWHDVHINHSGGSVLMGIDNCTLTAAAWNVTSASPSCLGIGVQRKTPRAKFLNLNGPLFLGGLPPFVTANHVTSAHFEGCLNDVRFNSALLDFSTRLKNVGTTPRCSDKNDLRETVTTNAKVPRAVRSLSVRPRTRSLVVKWILPKDKSGQVTGFKISYVEVNENDDPLSVTRTIFINSASEKGFTIERLTPGTRYRVDVRALSAAGLGHPSTDFAVTKNSKPKK